MRKTLILGSTLVAVTLGGCATTGGNQAQVIAQVQQGATIACGFLPTAATVANIFAAGNPVVSTVEQVVQAICSAVTAAGPKSLRKGAAVPTVNGVQIHGRFVGH